jgi:hypothetical protein
LVGPNFVTSLSQEFGDRIDADLLKTAFQRTARTIGVVTGVAVWDLHSCYPECAPSTDEWSWSNRAAELGKAVLVDFSSGEFVVTRDLRVILALTRGHPGRATGVTLPDGQVSHELPDAPGQLAILVAPDQIAEQLMEPAPEFVEDQGRNFRSIAILAGGVALAYVSYTLLRN